MSSTDLSAVGLNGYAMRPGEGPPVIRSLHDSLDFSRLLQSPKRDVVSAEFVTGFLFLMVKFSQAGLFEFWDLSRPHYTETATRTQKLVSLSLSVSALGVCMRAKQLVSYSEI